MAVGANKLSVSATATTGTATFSRPSGILDTDIIVFALQGRVNSLTASQITGIPPGFTLSTIHTAGLSASTTFLYGPAGTATSYQVATSASPVIWCMVGAYADAEVLDNTAYGGPFVSSTTATTGSGEVASGGAVVTSGGVSVNTTIASVGGGHTLRASLFNGGKGTSVVTCSFGDELRPTSGLSGEKTFVYNAAHNTGAALLVLAPTGGGTPEPAFPWKGTAPGRPWKGVGTDTFKGVAA